MTLPPKPLEKTAEIATKTNAEDTKPQNQAQNQQSQSAETKSSNGVYHKPFSPSLLPWNGVNPIVTSIP